MLNLFPLRVFADENVQGFGLTYNPSDGTFSLNPSEPTVHNKTVFELLQRQGSIMMTILNYLLAAGVLISIFMIIWGTIKMSMANLSGMPIERHKGWQTTKVAIVGLIFLGGFMTIANIAYGLFQ